MFMMFRFVTWCPTGVTDDWTPVFMSAFGSVVTAFVAEYASVVVEANTSYITVWSLTTGLLVGIS